MTTKGPTPRLFALGAVRHLAPFGTSRGLAFRAVWHFAPYEMSAVYSGSDDHISSADDPPRGSILRSRPGHSPSGPPDLRGNQPAPAHLPARSRRPPDPRRRQSIPRAHRALDRAGPLHPA